MKFAIMRKNLQQQLLACTSLFLFLFARRKQYNKNPYQEWCSEMLKTCRYSFSTKIVHQKTLIESVTKRRNWRTFLLVMNALRLKTSRYWCHRVHSLSQESLTEMKFFKNGWYPVAACIKRQWPLRNSISIRTVRDPKWLCDTWFSPC